MGRECGMYVFRRNLYRFLEWKRKWKCLLGGLEYFNKNLVGALNWIDVASYRERRSALANTVMNLQDQ